MMTKPMTDNERITLLDLISGEDAVQSSIADEYSAGIIDCSIFTRETTASTRRKATLERHFHLRSRGETVPFTDVRMILSA